MVNLFEDCDWFIRETMLSYDWLLYAFTRLLIIEKQKISTLILRLQLFKDTFSPYFPWGLIDSLWFIQLGNIDFVDYGWLFHQSWLFIGTNWWWFY